MLCVHRPPFLTGYYSWTTAAPAAAAWRPPDPDTHPAARGPPAQNHLQSWNKTEMPSLALGPAVVLVAVVAVVALQR